MSFAPPSFRGPSPPKSRARVRRFHAWLACALSLVWVLLLGGCSGSGPQAALPAPIQSTTVGIGDELEIRIAGQTEKFPTAFVVAPDGTVDLPYINSLKIDGLEPQEIAARVRGELMTQEFFTNPSVSVVIKSYNSKRIEVLGQVKREGSYPLEPNMTLVRAISLAGGFSPLARKSAVEIRRKVNGKTRRVIIDVDAIMDNERDDVPLQAGDSINVAQSPF